MPLLFHYLLFSLTTIKALRFYHWRLCVGLLKSFEVWNQAELTLDRLLNSLSYSKCSWIFQRTSTNLQLRDYRTALLLVIFVTAAQSINVIRVAPGTVSTIYPEVFLANSYYKSNKALEWNASRQRKSNPM